MRCIRCAEGAEGFAVVPGIGDAGEIRFYCDGCARRDRVKMRYWDGRDLDVGGHRSDPDLGESFATLVFSFEDLGRMRREDLAALAGWVTDEEFAAALVGSKGELREWILSRLRPDRARRIRVLLQKGGGGDPRQARNVIVATVRKL